MVAFTYFVIAGLAQNSFSLPSFSPTDSVNSFSTSLVKPAKRSSSGHPSDLSRRSESVSRRGEDESQMNHEWIPAGQIPGSVRAPCPWMNTAANHGFIHRNGRQVSVAEFDTAIVDSLGFAQDFAHAITIGMLTKLGVLSNSSADDMVRINIDQTNAHNRTEHDASLTRLDASQGDAATVQPQLVQQLLDDTVPVSYPSLNTSSIGRSRARRDKESQALGNPPLIDGFLTSARAEASLILLVMGDNTRITPDNADSFSAPKSRVQAWLDEERFPYEDGYMPSDPPRQPAELAALQGRVTKFETDAKNA